MPPPIKIALDATDAILAVDSLTRGFGTLNSTITAGKLAAATYGTTGELLKATLKGVDAEGRAFTATLKEGATGAYTAAIAFNHMADEAKKTAAAKTVLADASKKLRAEQKALEAQQAANAKRLGEMGRNVNQLAETFNRFTTYKVLNLITDALKEGATAARDFQIQVSLIRTISQDSQQSFGSWSESIKKASDESGLSIASVSKAAYDAISNQVAKGQAVFPFLKEAGNLARTTGGTIDQAGNLLASAMNSYGLSVGEAQKLSALFFYTIDEGRVKLGDMSETFGRVGILGKGLGVTIEELAGSVAYLTQKGVTTDDAFTFLKNVFVQMEKPSETLKAFFHSIGVESGKAAVEAYGFVEILNKINKLVKSGDASVAQLFPEIRAQQPIQAALNDIEGYNKIVAKAEDTAKRIDVYNKAIDIRAESPADFIDKEFNKIKNTFTVDVGQQLLDMSKKILLAFQTVSRVFTGSDSLSAGLDYLIITVRNLTIAFIAYRTGVGFATVAMLAYSAATEKAAVSTAKATVTTTAFGVAAKASLFGVGLAITAFAASRLLFSDSLKGEGTLFERYTDDIKKMREEVARANAVKIEPLFGKTFEEDNKKAVQNTLQILAQFSVQANEAITKARQNIKASTKDFEAGFHSYSDSLKNITTDLEKRISSSKELLKTLSRGVTSFKDASNQRIDTISENNLTGNQKTEFLNNKIKEYASRIDQQIAIAKNKKSTPEQSTEAVKEIDKYFDLIAEAEEKKFNNFLQMTRANRALVEANPNEPKWTEQDYQNEALRLNKGLNNGIDFGQSTLEKQLLSWWEQKRDIAKQITAETEKRIAIEQAAVDKQKKDQEDLQNKFKAFNEFSAFDDSGAVKKEFVDPVSKKVNIEAITNEQNRLKKGVLDAVATAGGPVAAQTQVIDFVNTRDRQERSLTEALIHKQKLENLAQQHALTTKNLEEERKKSKAGLDDAAGRQTTLLDKFAGTAVDGQLLKDEVSKANRIARVGGTDIVRKGESAVIYDRNMAAADFVKQASEKVSAAVLQAQNTKVNLNGTFVSKQEDIKALNDAIKEYIAALKNQGQKQFGDNYRNSTIPGSQFKYGELVDKLEKDNVGLSTTSFDASQFLWNGINAETKYKKGIDPVNQQIKELDPSVWNTVQAAQKNAATATAATAKAMNGLTESIQTFKASLLNQEKNRVVPQDTKIDNLPGQEPQIIGNALGGWIGNPRSTIGPDKYLRALGDGEHVMNAESASIFANELNYMNKVRRGSPTSSVLGGNTSNNVGDITVIVNESKTGQETGRQVWNKIRREIRRGNIK